MNITKYLLISLFLIFSLFSSVQSKDQALNSSAEALESKAEALESSAEALDNIVWIDVRSWVENKANGIEGDLHIPYRGILDGVEAQSLDKNTPIRLYCASGGRSGKALVSLKQAGYLNVENAGGIEDVKKRRNYSAAIE